MSIASFEVQETRSSPFESRDLDKPGYNGPERRQVNRRSGMDRRGDVRFDLSGDRRQSGGRREDDQRAQFW